MSFFPNQLEAVAKVARIAAIVGIASAGVPIVFLLVSYSEAGQGSRSQARALSFLVVLIGLYIIPGIAMLILAGRLLAGHLWAFHCIFALAILDLLKLFFASMLTPICFNLFLRLPTLALMACCLDAVTEIRTMYRQRRRERQQRGFAPILKNPLPPAPAPPPPARRLRPVPPPRTDRPGSQSQ